MKNHDQWLAIAKHDTPTQTKSHLHIHNNTSHIPHRKSNELHPPVTHIPAAAVPPKPKEPVAPAAKSFDINDLYNQIHNERKLKEQQVLLHNTHVYGCIVY